MRELDGVGTDQSAQSGRRGAWSERDLPSRLCHVGTGLIDETGDLGGDGRVVRGL